VRNYFKSKATAAVLFKYLSTKLKWMKKRKECEEMHILSEKPALNKNVTAEIKECLYNEQPHNELSQLSAAMMN
jgi:hypothetical protein